MCHIYAHLDDNMRIIKIWNKSESILFIKVGAAFDNEMCCYRLSFDKNAKATLRNVYVLFIHRNFDHPYKERSGEH